VRGRASRASWHSSGSRSSARSPRTRERSGALVAGYTVATLAGAARYGTDTWYGRIDPVSRVFRLYGRVAPVQRGQDGLQLRLPGAALTDPGTDDEPGSTAFVVALLWVTTFDGLVATPAWNALAGPLLSPVAGAGIVGGVLVALFYLVALLAGSAGSSSPTGSRPLAPGSGSTASSPRPPSSGGSCRRCYPSPPATTSRTSWATSSRCRPRWSACWPRPSGGVDAVQVAVLPAWFGTLQLALVVLGHLLAVWVAHALAMELFPGVLRPIRSQYPFVVVMMVYTMTSAWVVGQPTVAPVYL